MTPRWLLWIFLLVVTRTGAQTCEALFTFGSTGITIQFTDLSTHATGDPIVDWFWNFDDGSTSGQQHPTHTFPEPDRYDVNLTITTQNGCTSTLEIRIETCDFGLTYSVGSCNAQNEVPVSLDITDIFDNAEEIDIILDGQSVPGSPFLISAGNPVSLNVLVPGDGLDHTILVQSLDIETCSRSFTFFAEDCSSDCFLSALHVEYAPGVTHTVTVDDNFFSPQSIAIILGDVVHFTWAGGGHSTTSDATSGDDSWNSGVIGAGSTFDVNIHNPGTHNYYCIPHGGPNGVGMSGQILSNCPTGTMTDIQIGFTTSIANAQGYNVLWDNVPVAGSPFDYNGTGPQSVSISIAGDGMMHNLIVRDVADPACDIDMIYNAPDCGQGGGNPVCSISGILGDFSVCNNLNVTAILSVTVANGGSGFSVRIDNGPPVNHTYSGNTTNITVTLPGDGGTHSIAITDNTDPDCTTTINTTTPDCSLPCAITNLTATAASGNGGPSGIVHTVNVEDFQFNPNTINITVGDVVQWIWTGAIAHTSSSDQATGPNSWDSGLLNTGATYTSPVLDEGVHPYYCIPHGAPGGVGMSGSIHVLPACNEMDQTPVQISFESTSGGASGFNVIVDGSVAGTFPYAPGAQQSVSVFITGDGALHNIVVQDVADAACNANVGVVTPDCSGGGNPTCSVSLSPAIAGGCINNMVTVLLNVSATNSSATYVALLDGQPAGTFSYSDPNAQLQVPGNGQVHSIVITDAADTSCTASAQVLTPDCAQPCHIAIEQVVSGDTISHMVSVQDLQFFPAAITVTAGDTIHFSWTGQIPHTVTSDATSGPEVWDSGLLGYGATFDLVIHTPGVHPYYCIPHGAPGGIGMAGVITVLPQCTNNQQRVLVRFNSTQGSPQGYNVLVDGIPYGDNPRPYDDPMGQNEILLFYPADSAVHTITIQDFLDPNCMSTDTFMSGVCTATCQLSGLDFSISRGRKHQVLVKDFEFDPAVLQIELGDTVHFVWVGVIPHTVTSDTSTGDDVFNSGLLGQGASYDLVLTTTGTHPYYCIPHGAPGGVGMSGSMEVIDPCADGQVNVDFVFFASGSGQAYDVFNLGNPVVSDQPYQSGGIQRFTLNLPAAGQSHVISVVDTGDDSCYISIALDSFDCNDPCFMVRSDFEYDIQFSTLQVSFTDLSVGDITSWMWDFGDGNMSTQPNPVHQYAQDTVYTVCLTVMDVNGCSEQFCDKLRLGADVCLPSFTYQQDGLEFVFYNTSDVSSPQYIATWNFGDGSGTVQTDTASHQFAPGIYEVCITVTAEGCINTYCQFLDLTDPCLALRARYAATNQQGNPLSYQFMDVSSGPAGSRLWGFGDGQISTEANPVHVYSESGVYTICLLIVDTEGNCTSSDCGTLYVGTTGAETGILPMKRISAIPNPVSAMTGSVMLRGFDPSEYQSQAILQIMDMSGRRIANRQVVLEETLEISAPILPGPYYIRVVLGGKTYGTMIVVQ